MCTSISLSLYVYIHRYTCYYYHYDTLVDISIRYHVSLFSRVHISTPIHLESVGCSGMWCLTQIAYLPSTTEGVGTAHLHPVSITRFPSFRTQTLENLSRYLWTKGFLSNPDPGENLVSGNLVMETGCKADIGEGLKTCILKPHILRHHIPEHPKMVLRPISLLTLSLLTLLDSSFRETPCGHDSSTPLN